jgi:citrate synthase
MFFWNSCIQILELMNYIVSFVFWRIFKSGKSIEADNSLDYAANFSHMLGFDDPKMLELMRLYVTIHT